MLMPLMRLHSFNLSSKRLMHLFMSCFVFSIVSYGSRLKNSRKATGRDFIPLKVIKVATNVIDSHLYNLIMKVPEKSKYSEEPKAA